MYLIGSTYTHGSDHKSGTKFHRLAQDLEKGKAWIVEHLKYDKDLCKWIKRDNRMRLYYSDIATCWVIFQIPLQYVVHSRAGTLEQCQAYVRKCLGDENIEFSMHPHGVCIPVWNGTADMEYKITPLLLLEG